MDIETLFQFYKVVKLHTCYNLLLGRGKNSIQKQDH